jgi:hypothetical protein
MSKFQFSISHKNWLLIILGFVLLFPVLKSHAHNHLDINKNYTDSALLNKRKPVVFYLWGLLDSDIDDTYLLECIEPSRKKYNFCYKIVGGCDESRFKVRMWIWHNNRARRKMKRIHGEEWERNYFEEFKKCKEKSNMR